jgi:superfamily I DNA/RNA helicase
VRPCRPQTGLACNTVSGVPVPPSEAEETRIIYVALTRARRLCRVALPDDTPETVVDQFVACGFGHQPSVGSTIHR